MITTPDEEHVGQGMSALGRRLDDSLVEATAEDLTATAKHLVDLAARVERRSPNMRNVVDLHFLAALAATGATTAS